jgi:hypothetical protein
LSAESMKINLSTFICQALSRCFLIRNREDNKRKGMAFLREGNLKAANECFQRAVEVTTEMAIRLIRVSER